MINKSALFAVFAIIGLTTASVLSAADIKRLPAVETPSKILDVALGNGHTFSGQLVSKDGQPVANTAITLRDQGGREQTVKTDTAGYFKLSGVQPGTVLVYNDNTTSAFRVWPARVAPRAAAGAALVVTGRQTVRTQGDDGTGLGWLIPGGIGAGTIYSLTQDSGT